MIRSNRTGGALLALLAPALLTACGSPGGAQTASAQPSSAQPTSVQSAQVRTAAQPAPTPAHPIIIVPAVAIATPRPAKPFTLNTPVDRIAANPKGKAVLVRDVPGLMANKDYPLFDDMSLTEIAMLSGGQLTKSKLDLVKTDLIEISSN